MPYVQYVSSPFEQSAINLMYKQFTFLHGFEFADEHVLFELVQYSNVYRGEFSIISFNL